MSPAPTPDLHEKVHLLYADHHGWLHAWLRSRLGCPQRAADLTQDTFVRLLASGQALNLNEPRAFLITVAKRMLISFWRRNELERAYLEALASLPVCHHPSEEERALLLEAVQILDNLLDGLPRRARQAFLLNRLDGLSHPRIATELGVSLATVERDIRQAYIHCCLSGLQP